MVSGVDFEFSWSKISVASAYLQSGCLLVGTNPDVGNRWRPSMDGVLLDFFSLWRGRGVLVAGVLPLSTAGP